MENKVEDYGQMNFTLPHDVVTLPSGGMFYKNKKDSIKVGYLTASDENILLAGGQDMTLNLLRAKVFELAIACYSKVEYIDEDGVDFILELNGETIRIEAKFQKGFFK